MPPPCAAETEADIKFDKSAADADCRAAAVPAAADRRPRMRTLAICALAVLSTLVVAAVGILAGLDDGPASAVVFSPVALMAAAGGARAFTSAVGLAFAGAMPPTMQTDPLLGFTRVATVLGVAVLVQATCAFGVHAGPGLLRAAPRLARVVLRSIPRLARAASAALGQLLTLAARGAAQTLVTFAVLAYLSRPVGALPISRVAAARPPHASVAGLARGDHGGHGALAHTACAFSPLPTLPSEEAARIGEATGLLFEPVPGGSSGATAAAALRPRALHLADSGAGIHAINDEAYAIPGTMRRNDIAISTANGTARPEYMCDASISVRAKDGSAFDLHLPGAIVMPESQNNLVSLGLLARQGVETRIAAGDGSSELRFPDGRVVQLLNAGVLVIPSAHVDDVGTSLCSAAPPVTYEVLHNRFNGRRHEVLKNLPTALDSTSREWSRALGSPQSNLRCHHCLRAHADKVPSKAHVPQHDTPGYISFDIFEMGLPHAHGGQRYVIGFHDNYSKLNRLYLLHKKSDAPVAMRQYHAWARSHGVDIRRMHADNAPELTGAQLKAEWAERGVRLTACAPWEPRGNGEMERQWRTIANDTRHVLAVARLPSSYWWYAMRGSVAASWAIPFNGSETPWFRWAGRKPSALKYKVIGCLAYYKVRAPSSKAEMRGRAAVYLGLAEDQAGHLFIDIETRTRVVTPHARFVEDEFPGLRRSSGGVSEGAAQQHPFTAEELAACDDPFRASESDPTRTSDGAPLPPRPPVADCAGKGSSQLVADGVDDAVEVPVLPADGESFDSPLALGDAGDGVAIGGDSMSPAHSGRPSLISSRLDRTRRHPPERFVPAMGAALTPLGTPYFLYIGSGPRREGDLQSHVESVSEGRVSVINVDIAIGGYDHDITHESVQTRVLELARHASCVGAFISIPCKTFSVLRGKPGVENSYPLRSLDHVLGIPRDDGTIPRKVVLSNLMSDFAALVMATVHSKGGVFAAESPPSRAAHSRFPIEGREKHASQFDHPSWVHARESTGAQLINFDQCPFFDDPSTTSPKKTALMVNPKAFESFHGRFAPLICTHGFGVHPASYGIDEQGQFKSRSTENYPSKMNRLIAEALLEGAALLDAARSTAMLDWQRLYDPEGLEWPEQRDVPDFPSPWRALQGAEAVLSASGSFSSRFYESSIDNQIFAAPVSGDADTPSYRQARASAQWPQWEQACEDEISSLKQNGTIDEDQSVLEDTLPTWNPARKAASEVVNILWVLRVKYVDGAFEKFKARAVFDGRRQKANNPSLETFSPACRSTTHKLLTAEACRLGYRLRTWDVVAAYLKGKFEAGSDPLYARPPLGYRTYVDGIALIWKLNTPLYGEADAGRIWYKTFVKFLIEERGFSQSRYDPCFLWKLLADMSRFNCVIYVDDGYSSDNGSSHADAELAAINERFSIKIFDASFFLGNNVVCHSRSCVTLSSRAYIARTAEKYLPQPVHQYPKYSTPCDKSLVADYEAALAARQETLASTPKEYITDYASKVGALIYVVPVCRVDCAFAIGVLARCLTFPTPAMSAAADRCLIYLAQHPELGVTYDSDAENPTLHGYSDSNWTVGHSTSGWAILYAGAVIGYGSKRQQSIALSSTEAEIMAASQAATEIMYFRGILREFGHDLGPTPLYVDNQGAVELSRDMKSCQRSRHIERRFLKVRELVALGEVSVHHVPTDLNRADVLTKPLDKHTFDTHVNALCGVASLPQQGGQ